MEGDRRKLQKGPLLECRNIGFEREKSKRRKWQERGSNLWQQLQASLDASHSDHLDGSKELACGDFEGNGSD